MATAAMGAPAPQQLVQLHNGIHSLASPAFVRTIPQTSSHAQHTVVHNAPTVVRTVAAAPHALHHVVAQPTVVRTVAAPATHVVHAAPVQRTIVRTVPTATYEHVEEEVEIEASPNYSFGYSVADVRSGDAKTREESRDGDQVVGSYTVADPDGRLRRVTYTADKEHGFQATVTYDGEEGPPAIPIDTPQQTSPVDEVVVAEPTVDEEEDDSATVIRTVQANPTIFRTVAPAHQVFHAAPVAAHQVVRTSTLGDVHALHNVHTSPVQHTVVRTAAIPQATTHLVHSAAPQQFVRVAGGNLHQTHAIASSPFGVVRAIPTAGTTLIHA